MLFGPLPAVFVQKLERMLKEHGAGYKIFVSHEELEAYRERQKAIPVPAYYPSFPTPGDFVYIEVALKDVLIVRGELEKMGIPVRSDELEPELSDMEYLCPRCKEVSMSPGLCPIHKIPMLEFSEWVATKNAGSEKMWRLISWILFALVVIGLVVENFVAFH